MNKVANRPVCLGLSGLIFYKLKFKLNQFWVFCRELIVGTQLTIHTDGWIYGEWVINDYRLASQPNILI